MSAIAGFVRLDDAPAGAEDLARMLKCMSVLRHVDSHGMRQDGKAALGHLLKRNTPEDAFENQPFSGKHGRYILIGDIRLDNREELASALGIASTELAHTPDSALVHGAWEKWLRACPEKLLGDFAFAIWDRDQRSLFCARDHLGVRPFYYARTSSRLVFASAIKGLLGLPDVSGQLDEVALADYLVFYEGELERTCYRYIRRLPPAHTLTLDARGFHRLHRYWAPDPDFELSLSSNGEYAEGLREHLRRAVECRMRSTTATGVLLSGGLDSSTVTCIAADIANRKGQRITAVASVLPEGSTGPEWDEWDYIREVAASRKNIDVRRVTAQGAGLLTGLDEALLINDQPFQDLFHYMTRALFESAAEQGAKNIFTGFGGDYVVSSWGPGYMVELLRCGKLGALWRELLARRQLHGSPLLGQLKGQVIRPLLPACVIEAIDRGRGRGVAAHIRQCAIDAEFAKRIDLESRLRTNDHWGPPPVSLRMGEVRALNSSSISEALEFMAHIGGAMGVAVHNPLVDKRLVEYCLALPASQKSRDGWARFALRQAVEGIVPKRIQWRRDKGPFSPDFDRRVTRDKDMIIAKIRELETDTEHSGYIDASKLFTTMRDRPEYQVGARWQLDTMLRIGLGLVALRFLQRGRAPMEPGPDL